MELKHTFVVPIGIDEAWTAFNDLERIAPCFPGAQITSVDGDDFTGLAKVKLGPISLQYTGTGRWVERDQPGYRAVIEASGKDKRGNGTAGATITAHLEPEGEGTRVVVDTDLKITGRPAQFGRGVIQDVGNKLLDQFAACLSTRLGPAGEPEVEAPVEEKAVVEEQAAVAVQQPAAQQPAAQQPAAQQPAAQQPAAQQPAAQQPAPAPRATAEPAELPELDLGAVVGPAMLRRYGPLLAAVLATAMVTWWIARRGR